MAAIIGMIISLILFFMGFIGSVFVRSFIFYGCGVAGGGVGGGVPFPLVLAGGKVLSRNSSRTPALAGSVAGHCRSAAFWMRVAIGKCGRWFMLVDGYGFWLMIGRQNGLK